MKKTIIASMMLSASVAAQELEVVEVIGNQTALTEINPTVLFSLSEVLDPTNLYYVGGAGAFSGFTERGTMANHTLVFRNGVPVNDAGAGWYDFGHDYATGNESVRVVSGPQGVLYGSSSMGGTVFLNDTITPGSVLRYGSDVQSLSVSPSDWLNLSKTKINNGSVRNDNTEEDLYDNKSVRVAFDIAGFAVNYSYTDYSYDYDACYDDAWALSNNCFQNGTKQSLSIRDNNITFGYSNNKAAYYTGDLETYRTDADRFYVDIREMYSVTNDVNVLLGITGNEEQYVSRTQTEVDVYAFGTYQNWLDFGARLTDNNVVYRVGAAYGDAFVTFSTSYRNPTLYELHGDGLWVMENTALEAEKARGVEVGYGALSAFRYDFTQGIDYDFGTYGYVNTGEYSTQGVRLEDKYSVLGGTVNVYAGYTDSELPRIPKYKTSLAYNYEVNDYTFTSTYTAQLDRGFDYNGAPVDDVKTVDIEVAYKLSDHIDVVLSVDNVLNREFEVAPGYDAGDRTYMLTIQVK